MTQDNKEAKAIEKCDILFGLLHGKWTKHVWETWGGEWYYSVSFGNENHTVVVLPADDEDGKYYAFIDHKYHSGNHDDPNVAVAETMEKLSDAIIDLMSIYERISGSKFE